MGVTLTHCQDHVLSENIWFVWSKTSYSGYKRPCHQAGRTTNEQGKIELLSQWKLEAEFRKYKIQNVSQRRISFLKFGKKRAQHPKRCIQKKIKTKKIARRTFLNFI